MLPADVHLCRDALDLLSGQLASVAAHFFHVLVGRPLAAGSLAPSDPWKPPGSSLS